MNRALACAFGLLVGCGAASAASDGSVTSTSSAASATASMASSAPEKSSSTPVASSSAVPSAAAAAAGADPCPTKDGLRVCSAVEFQKAWKTTTAADAYKRFPPGKFRMNGTVTKLEPTDKNKGQTGDLWVYMKGDSSEVGFRFDVTSKDLAKALKTKVGDNVTFTCEFHGLEEGGIVTLQDCAL